MAVVYRRDFGATAHAGTAEDIVRAAEGLIPVLRSRADAAEQLRRMPDETCRDIRRSGLARILQPARYGGTEAPLSAMVDVLIPISAGCASTGWCLAQYIMHNYMLARWPVQAQEEVWRAAPDCLIGGILIPRLGRARAVPGGYTLTGKWPFVSGVNTSDWCILSGLVERPGGGSGGEERYFVVPTASIEILDTWHSIGLRASASNDVRTADLFVPEHMTLPIEHLKGGQFPGRAINTAPLFRPPVYMTFGVLLASSVLGMAEFMFEEYLAQSRNRAALMSGLEVGSYASHHIKLGEVSASLQAAGALLRADCAEIMEIGEADRQPSDIERSNYRCNAAFSGQLAFAAARIVWDLVGARGAYASNPIARAFQDICVASRHVTQNWDINATEHGRARLRMPLTNPSL
jgi:3-hydroxy-9,10-secoandrosta-1,3,5(10)-triene-9,17-dione monooxygenase